MARPPIEYRPKRGPTIQKAEVVKVTEPDYQKPSGPVVAATEYIVREGFADEAQKALERLKAKREKDRLYMQKYRKLNKKKPSP